MDESVRILLIEDDEAIAELYRLRLTSDGYDVEVARDGEQGFRRALDGAPDLVYLDIRLPVSGGLDVLQRLRQEPRTRSLPVVILTNFDEPDLREMGVRLGALEFLVKADTTPAQLSESTVRWLDDRLH